MRRNAGRSPWPSARTSRQKPTTTRKACSTNAYGCRAGSDPAPLKCDNPIAEEFKLGMEVGVDGTPTVFAPDGSKIGGYLTPDQLQAQLERVAAQEKPGA